MSMRILLVGRFGSQGETRRPRRIDLDSFDDTLQALAPALVIGEEKITFSRLDDFHPDELYRRLERFADLREVRRRLLDPSTFAATAAALEGQTEDDARTLERLLGARPAAPETPAGFIEQIVAPYIVPDIAPRQQRLVGAIDEAAGQHLRALLRHPPLQRLEAAWRAVHRLVTTVEAEDLAIYLLDASAHELGELGLVDGAPDGRPWSLLAVDETFTAGERTWRR
jgi:type VI secretion system protein ImpC